MTRRAFLSGAAAGAGGLLATPLQALGRPPHLAADLTLRIGAVKVDVAPGKTIQTTGYNGSAPAPVLRLAEGVPITVDIFNDTDIPEYVHWHGFPVSAAIDGTPEENSLAVPPHGHLQYRMTPRVTGSRWVHSHAMVMDNLQRGSYSGQFGFVYIEPRNNPGRYDQEIFLAMHEWDPFFVDMDDATPGPEVFGETDWGPNMVEVAYRIGSINGKSLGHGEPIRVREGQRVLFHFLNASATENIQLSLPAHRFLVTALDGNPVPRPQLVNALDLVAAERVDAIVEMKSPGVWILGSTDDDVRGSGLGVLVEYAGRTGVATRTTTLITAWDYTLFGRERPVLLPDETLPMVIVRVPPDESGNERWMINGKSFNAADPPVVLNKGRRYRLAFDNTSGDAHPLHLHRNSFELTKVEGKLTSGVWKDVVVVNPYQKVEVDFVANQEGLTLFHCHNQFHMDHGFQSLFEIR